MPCKRFTVAFLLVMFAVLLVVEPLPVRAASSLVQRNSTWCNTFHGYDVCNDAATLSVSFASGVTSGNLLVVAVTVGSNPPVTVISISDSRGSSFTQAVSDSMTNNYAYAYIYYAILSSSGPDMVTATFSAVPYKDPNDPLGGTGIAYLHIFEVSGVTTTGITTGTGAGLLSGVGTVSTSPAAFQSGAFLVAIATENILTGNWVVGTGFTLSPNPPYDQYNDLSMTQYSTSGVVSPTTFPATLSASGGNDKDWVEVGAAFNPATSLSVENPVSHLNTLDVAVGSVFSVDIWIRGIPSNDPMDSFGFDLSWNPVFMQYDHSQVNQPSDWSVTVDDANAASGTLSAGGVPLQNGTPYSGDHMWVSIYFRCLKSGVDTIEIPFASWMDDVGGFQLSFDSVLGATVTQTGGYSPPVGGELLAVNKLTVFAPYLALVGLAATIAVGFGQPRKKPGR